MGSHLHSPQTIAVDLDGTALLTDTLHESVLALIRSKPIYIFVLPFWLVRGIAYLKLKVAKHHALDVTTLPYNISFIDWLRVEKASGKEIVLCTAANDRVAEAVSKHLDLFDHVIASDANTNLKGANKRNELEKRYGDKGYDYAGNGRADLEVWAGASHAIVVNASGALQRKVSKVASISHIFPSDPIAFLDWLRALRIHQWLKNFLLFIPILAAQQLSDGQSIFILLVAFFSFSFCASSVYITNDLLDLENDRRHPRKKYRPFASAKLPISLGVLIAPILITLSIVLGKFVGKEFLVVLILYLLLTVLYSLVFKRIVLVDCLVLATLYTVRIIAGAVAVSLSLSFWLLAFSVFIFLSLALVKRYSELIVQADAGKSVAHGRGYVVSDASLLQTLGVSSGYISVLIIALYMHSETVKSLYVQPIAIWLMLPILLFWVSWMWLKATRGEMHDDPIVFAVRDKASLLVAALMAIVFLYAANGMPI